MNYITKDQLQEMYDDYLDEIYEDSGAPFNLSGSRVLQETDPIAYSCGLSDYADNLSQDDYIVEDYNDETVSTCQYCNELYDTTESDANRPDDYCSLDCEESNYKECIE
jgi:hypothetical protein